MQPRKPKTRPTRMLTEEDRYLWEKVKRTVTAPIKSDVAMPGSATMTMPEPVSVARVVPARKKPVVSPVPPKSTRPAKDKPPTLDRKTRSKISRGSNRLGGSIDLHGMRQDEAHRALRQFLARAQQQGERFVIVITGKGTRSASDFSYGVNSGQGVLRSAVPRWFATDSFRDLVVGFSEAAQSHGGGGALYVQIRSSSAHRSMTGKRGGR